MRYSNANQFEEAEEDDDAVLHDDGVRDASDEGEGDDLMDEMEK